jgi:DegV family protein with EDD domain
MENEKNPLIEVAIVTDSISDVPVDEQKRLDIVVVPAVVTLDGETYHDGVDLTRAEFYRRLPELKAPATTAAPSPVLFEEAYDRLLTKGVKRILSIHIPSTLSGLINVVSQAAKPFGERVTVFDSGQISLASGYQAIEAAEVAIEGGSIEMAIARAEHAKENVRLIAFIDNLTFLKRSGRINWMTAGLGNLLNVKLLLEVRMGVIERLGQVRTRRKALEQLKTIAESWGPLERLDVPHTVVPEIATEFAQRLTHLCEREPQTPDVTTAIGAHIGPGALGIMGLKKLN